MAVVAQLYQDDTAANRRNRERQAVRLGATIRDSDARPLDAVVHDLSTTGFLVQLGETLPVGAIVRVGLSGIGSSGARVMWRRDGMCGCAFVEPIGEDDIETALHARTVTQGKFATAAAFASSVTIARHRPSGKIAMLTVFGLSALLWTAAVAGLAAFR